MSVPYRAFESYLKLGSLWPQLRTPLVAAIASDLLVQPDVRASMRLLPDDVQTDLAASRVQQLHLRFGIRTGPMSAAVIRDEWRKSVNGLVFLTLASTGAAPHARYDGYFDYATPGALSVIGRIIADERHAVDTVRRACETTVLKLESARGQGGLFRFSFVEQDHTGAERIDAYFRQKCPQSEPRAAPSYDVCRRFVRLEIMNEVEERLRSALQSYPAPVRDALSLGMDDLARARARGEGTDVPADRG